MIENTNIGITGNGTSQVTVKNSGNVTQTIQHLPDSSNPNQAGLKELLTRLQALIEQADNKTLTPDDKANALEEVKALAEASQLPDTDEKKKRAKKALTFFKGFIGNMPKATKIVEDLGQLSTAIGTFFGS